MSPFAVKALRLYTMHAVSALCVCGNDIKQKSCLRDRRDCIKTGGVSNNEVDDVIHEPVVKHTDRNASLATTVGDSTSNCKR